METRVEKSRRRARARRIRRFKIYLILFLIAGAVYGINWVNEEAKSYKVLENPVLVNYNHEKRIFTFLGENYYIDFRILKRQD